MAPYRSEFVPKEAEKGVYPVYIKMDSPLDLSKKIKDSPDELHKLKQILEEIQARDLEVARRLDSAEGAKSNWERSVHFNTDDRLMTVSALTGSPDAVKYKIAVIEDKLDRHSDFLDTPLEDVSYHDVWFWHQLQEYTEELEALKRRDPEVLRELYDPEQYIRPSISGGMSGQAEADDLSLGILFGDDGLFVTPNDVSDIFKKHGYDGIISDPEWNLPEVIIFEPKNVKSKFNKGTFEVDNPDIHASLAGAFDDPDVAYG